MKKITRSHKPLILITNDDGIQAKGIREVADFLKPLGDILIVAPDAPRSGQSSAITVTSPLRMKVVEERDGFLAIRTNGTPVDCIKLSMNILLDERPDLIVSGINHGSNSGVSVIYSGRSLITYTFYRILPLQSQSRCRFFTLSGTHFGRMPKSIDP